MLGYHYDKLCWYDIFIVFKENEFSKENEIWLYVICEEFVKDRNPVVKWGYTLSTSKL
jgi:hypothetical protein